MKVVNTREYVSVLRELTEEGHEVSMLIVGSSMSPFFIHERDTIYFRKPDRKLKRGDMVFYQRDNGQFVMHRIFGKTKDGYQLVGDAQSEIETGIREDQIFARVVRVKRKGKMMDENHFWWIFFAKIWIRMIPFRKSLTALYGIGFHRNHNQQ